MTAVSKNGVTLQVIASGPVIVNFDILRGRIKVDQGNSPYVEGEIVVSQPDAATLALLDPRKLPQCIVYPTEDGWLNGAFVLSLRSRRIESGEVVLSVASFESLLLDYAPLADDYTPLTLASSLRAIVNYVLGVAKPSLVVLPWELSASPAHDADMTPVWSVINLPGNSGFEGNTTAGYVAAVNVSGLTVITTAGFVKHGARALRYTATAAGASRLDIGASNQAFRASPGRTYTVAIEHRSSAARSAVLGVRFVNGDGDTIGTATHNFTSPSTQLSRQRITATAPAGTEFIWPYILTSGNTAGQFHYLDDVMIVEGEFLPDFFDGNTTDTTIYDYAWAGATNASQSIRTLLADGVAPDALVWRAGVSALDFLLPLVQAAGFRLVNEGDFWTLRDETYTKGTLAETRRNRELNPRAVGSGSTAPYGARFGWTRAFVTTGSPSTDLAFNTVCRFTSIETGTLANRGVDSYGNPDLTNPGTTGDWIAGPVLVPGQKLTVSRYVRMSGADWQVGVRFHDGAGNWIGPATYGTATTTTGTWSRPFWSGVVPAGATRAVFTTRTAAAVAVTTSSEIQITGMLLETTESLGDYFDGSYPTTPAIAHSWAGTENASPSIRKVPTNLLVLDGNRIILSSEVIDRTTRLWYDAQVTRYEWSDRDGIQRQAVDSYALDPDDYRLVNFEEKTQPYPGPGYSEYSVRRAQERGREITVTAMSDWTVTAEQPAVVTYDGTARAAVVQSVEFDIEEDRMTVVLRPYEEVATP